MGSWIRRFCEQRLSMEDVIYLSRLLNTALPISECLDLIETKGNMKTVRDLKEKLDAGERIEDAVKGRLPKQIEGYTQALLASLPLSKALSLALEFQERTEKERNGLIRGLAYPCLLLFFTLTGLYLFDLYGIDSIFVLIRSFEGDLSFYDDLRLFFRILVETVYLSSAVIAIAALIGSRPKNIVLLYILVSKHCPNSLLNICSCTEFMSLFLICTENGFHTRESLQLLKSMKMRPVVSFLAFHLDEKLMEGATLKEAVRQDYYDSSLTRFIKIANDTGDFTNVIRSYVELSSQRVGRRLKRYTLTLQLFTYVLIGMIIIFIYRILFMPMQAISIF